MPLKCHLSCECCRPQDTVSQSSTVSQCHTLASEVCDQSERRPSPTSRSSSSSPTQHHRDKRAFFWNRALVRLRNSFRSSNKVSSESSLSPHQQNSSAQVNSACVRLSTTSNSVEEDFVWGGEMLRLGRQRIRERYYLRSAVAREIQSLKWRQEQAGLSW